MSRWNRLGKHRACPVCGGERKDCRSLDLPNGITQYHCRTDNPNPDFELKKPDQLGFGIYFEKAELDAQSQQQKEDWIRQRQAEKKAREEREAKEYAEGLPVELRDREFRKVLSQLSLNANHRADLERRGLTPEQIEKGMFRSVSKDGTLLHTPISQYLPGAWDWGKSFKSPADGYLCPVFNNDGLIIGAQVKANDANNGKYKWLKTKKSSHLQNGQLPLTIHKSGNDDNLRLVEGVSKPYFAHCRRGQTYVGAAGGNLASSPQQLKQYIDYVQPQKIILCPDAGSRANKNVLRQYRAIAQLLKSWGLTLWVEDWGQSDNKDNFDVDEIDPNTETQIIPFDEWDKEANTERLWTNPVSQSNLTIKGTAISFGKTITELLSGQKTVTRRVWKDSHAQKFLYDWDAKPGEFIYPALNKGYHVGGKRVGYIRLTHKPYLEKLADMPASDLAAEGFPQLSKQQFIDRFFESNDQQEVWVIRFELISQQDQTLTKQQWWEKFGLPREVKNLAKFVQAKFNKATWKYFKRTGELPANPQPNLNPDEQKRAKQIIAENTTAITLWKPPIKLGRPYIEYTGADSIPTKSEYQKLLETENWLIKQPEIKFDLREQGDAPAQEAIAKGWTNILDKHGCGEGKSHTYGSLTADKLEGIERTVFAASNHRNPTVASVEHRKDLIAKHNGLTYDHSKNTPLGNPYQIATPAGKTDDITPPCIEHKLYNTAYELQLNAYSGKGSPICQKCPLFTSGCEYLEERRNTLGTEKIKDDAGNVIAEVPNHPDIRADLNGLNKFDVPTALIVDEIDQTLESSKPLYIGLNALSKGLMQLDKLKDRKLANVLEWLIKKIYRTVEDYKPNSLHGLSHEETAKLLPTKSELEQIINDIYAEDLTNPDIDLWGKIEYIYNTERDPSRGELISKVVGEYKTFSIPSIDDLIEQCQKLLKTNFDEILDSGMTPGEKAEALNLNHTLDFLSPILKVINGYRKVNLSLSDKYLTITKPWYRHQNIIKSAEVNIFLDATMDSADLRQSLKLDKDEPILVFSSLEKDHSNLTLKFAQDFGHASNQRRSGSEFCETERITAFINQVAENHKNEKIGLIDYKQYAYSHKLPKNVEMVGHWGNDSRGSNQFLDCTVMVNIGDFTENLGALAAKYQCDTGQITNPTNLSGGYGRYVQRGRIADLEQAIGRLRATNRPDEQLTIYLPGKWTDEETRAIASRLSGVNIEKVATYDISPKAAPKGQQSERKFVEQIWLHIQRREKFTQEQIAKVVGLTRGRVSQIAKDLSPGGYKQIKKMLVLLWDTLNKTNIPEKALSELPEDAQWFIKEWVPNFHEYVELGETLEDTIENLKVGIDSHGVSLLEYLSVDTIIDLIKLFMAPMPSSFWESLRSRSGTDVLSPPEPIPI